MAAPSQPIHASEVDGRAWSHIGFISDVHLQRSEDATFQAWRHYMQSVQADALFILGDHSNHIATAACLWLGRQPRFFNRRASLV